MHRSPLDAHFALLLQSGTFSSPTESSEMLLTMLTCRENDNFSPLKAVYENKCFCISWVLMNKIQSLTYTWSPFNSVRRDHPGKLKFSKCILPYHIPSSASSYLIIWYRLLHSTLRIKFLLFLNKVYFLVLRHVSSRLDLRKTEHLQTKFSNLHTGS